MNVSLINNKWLIGTHLPYDKSISKTLINSINNGQYCFQFFLGSPQSLTRSKVTDEDKKKFLDLSTRFPTLVFTHFPYIANLAGSKDILAWNGDEDQDDKMEKVILSLESELETVASFGGHGVVIHPGSYPNKMDGCSAIVKTVDKINFRGGMCLILENSAGQGSTVGSVLEELAYIRNNSKNKENIKFCVDTAHIWGKGLYDLSNKEGIDCMFLDMERILGLNNIALFHLNDSKVKKGSNVDRHELVCEGEIWSGKRDVFNYFLDCSGKNGIPCIMETEPCDMDKF